MALGRRAVAGAHGQEAAGHRHRGRRDASQPRPGCSSRDTARPAPTRTACASGSARDDGVTLQLQAKSPGDDLVSRPVDLEVSYDEALFPHRQEAYQRLLEDAMDGDHRRFGRADGVEEQWRIVDGVVKDPPPVELYRAGTWGPPGAERLAAGVGGWIEPLAD